MQSETFFPRAGVLLDSHGEYAYVHLVTNSMQKPNTSSTSISATVPFSFSRRNDFGSSNGRFLISSGRFAWQYLHIGRGGILVLYCEAYQHIERSHGVRLGLEHEPKVNSNKGFSGALVRAFRCAGRAAKYLWAENDDQGALCIAHQAGVDLQDQFQPSNVCHCWRITLEEHRLNYAKPWLIDPDKLALHGHLQRRQPTSAVSKVKAPYVSFYEIFSLALSQRQSLLSQLHSRRSVGNNGLRQHPPEARLSNR